MASDSPSHPYCQMINHASRPMQNMSPAQAIAEAWKRETPESQRQWRMADVRAREQYVSPPRWTVAKKAVVAKM
ncbi:hypothetical protein WOLCODRAFT_28303 [Wolfiporia cocos MD-104 SS10]|uniref:Uncharacterized protein n=1 Tax=Wolfiporia cocos (strain MD-104) TaxID=742152 RepID=A0A2H3J8B5_WOLCO|nr:hypothetical protein WOLCODRAFT_28303 [Wolfiporia cocos MD-104 SS10]